MGDEGELVEGQMAGTKSSGSVSTKQDEIAALAGIEPKRVLTTIAHRIEWMREAYRRTRKDGAVGVDRGWTERRSRRTLTRTSPVFSRG